MFTKQEVDQLVLARDNGTALSSPSVCANILGITLKEFNEKNINDGMQIISFNNIESSLETVHWDKLLLNKYRYSIKLPMLLNEGYRPEMVCSVEGDRKGKENSKERVVIFDKDYVIKKLIREVVIPFRVMRIEEVLELVEEAYYAFDKSLPAYTKHTEEYKEDINIYEQILLQSSK